MAFPKDSDRDPHPMKQPRDSHTGCRPPYTHGLIFVAIGLGTELLLRTMPIVAGSLGLPLTMQHLTGSSVGRGEIAVVAGSLIRIADPDRWPISVLQVAADG